MQTLLVSNTPRSSYWVMPLLVLLSGFCGISYEILYTRLLGNILGNQFLINATVLLTFLLGIGFGTLYAHRFRRWLWLVEVCIGLYALFMAFGYSMIDEFIYTNLPFLGVSILAGVVVCFVLLIIPAFLVGCSLPLFASLLQAAGTRSVFSFTYAIYNLGAAATAIAMEFYLIRNFGLKATTLLLAGLNFFVAAALLGYVQKIDLKIESLRSLTSFPRRILLGLAVASVASAIFQLLMMKITEFVFGPFNETFSLVLAMVLIGLAIGSTLCNRLSISFTTALLIAMTGLAWLLFIHPIAISWYASLYEMAAEYYVLHVLLKFGLVAVLMGLPAIGFGATIPALLRSYHDIARESGQLLFWSATANALGFCLMAFILHQWLDYGVILIAIAGLVLLAIGIQKGFRHKVMWVASSLMAIALTSYAYSWNELLLYVGHKNLHSLSDLEEELDQRFYADRFKGPQDVFAITWRGGEPYFFINGYISVALSSPSEKHVGAISSMLAPRVDQALVLGMGTGASASVVGLAFESTDVVEINKVVLDNLHRMAEYNLDIEKNKQVNIIHDDGIHFLKTTEKKYSLILNTVTSPLYFSSSKLYTQDFFELAKSKLTPDGVYVTWVDWHVGDRGLDIILQTLDQSFEQCWLSYMTKNYFLLACSQSPISVRQHEHVAQQEVLKKHFAQQFELPLRLLPYSVIVTDLAKFKGDADIPINTLDHPILEFEMARLQEYTSLGDFKQRLRNHQDLQAVQQRVSATVPWNAGEFLYYADMRLSSGSNMYQLLSKNSRQQLGVTDQDYAQAAINVAAELGTASAFYEHGEQLYNRDLFESAIFLLRKAIKLDPQYADAWYVLGKSQSKLKQNQDAMQSFYRAQKLGTDRNVEERIMRLQSRIDGSEE
ncbi:MAG: spermidine synthase [Kiritimatiellia bacterium]|jgi:spermidine synthase